MELSFYLKRPLDEHTFQNKNDPKGLLFNNSSYNTIEPLLDNLILKKKTAGMLDTVSKQWGWLITRNFNWILDVGLFDYKYSMGELKRIKKYDIFNKNAVNKIINIYKELAQKSIDGILIQDDLIIKFNEGMSESGIKEFEKITGIPANMQKMIKKGNH